MTRRRHVDAGIQLGEFAQQARREIRGGGDRHQAQFALLQSPPFVHRHGVTVEDAEDFAGGLREFLAVRGKVDFLADLFEQRHADRFRQLLDLHGHRGLGEKQLFGGAGEAAQAGDGLEDFKLAEGSVMAHVGKGSVVG